MRRAFPVDLTETRIAKCIELTGISIHSRTSVVPAVISQIDIGISAHYQALAIFHNDFANP